MSANSEHLPEIPEIVLTELQRLRVLEVGHRQLAEQLAEMVVAMRGVQSCMQVGETRMTGLENELKNNSATTTEVRDILNTARGAFKFFGYVGVVTKWLAAMAAAGYGAYKLWYMITHGGALPPDGKP